MFSAYVHHLDPIILQFTEGIALRWYGLSYLAGFFGGYVLLKYLAQRKLWVLAPAKTADFIAAAALLGVFVGGRLGYILFYQIPRDGWASVLNDPLVVFRVWDGGMASHGGILGLVLFTFYYSWRHKVSWTGLGDGLCVVSPIGIFFGRMANFINGELYGRVTSGVPWAVKFPSAFLDWKSPEASRFEEALAAAAEVDPDLRRTFEMMGGDGGLSVERPAYYQQLLEAARESEPVREAIGEFLEARHPSQIYEGILEGAAVFGILWFVRIRYPRAPHGLLTGLFFALYATGRIVAEQFREPDAAWVIEGFLTRGQFLSLFMYLFATAFLVYAWRRGPEGERS